MGGFYLALVGMLLWGVGYATQDTLLKAMVAGVLPEGQRNFAFGLYYAGHGVGWLNGRVVTGLLDEQIADGSHRFCPPGPVRGPAYICGRAESGTKYLT